MSDTNQPSRREIWSLLCPRIALPESEHGSDDWYVIVPARGGIVYEKYSSQEEAQKRSSEMLRMLRDSGINDASRVLPLHQVYIERAPGRTQPRKVRLPIYGERKVDSELRRIFDDPGFGEFLFEGKNLDRYEDLICLIDEEFDPSYATVFDVEEVIRKNKEELLNEEEHAFSECEDDFDEDDEYEQRIADAIDVFERARLAWVLRHLGRIRVKEGMVHQCVRIVDPIDNWPESGGVYFVRAGDYIKIGKANSIKNLLKSLSTSSPVKLELLAVAPGGLKEESEYHDRWKELRGHGEWFRADRDLVEFIAILRSIK